MKLANLASKEGFQLSVVDIFQYPDLSDLTRAIQILNKATGSPPEPFSLLTNDTREDAIDLAAQMCSIPRNEIEDIYPCSPQQENQTAMT
ncbi:Acyl carrier protein-like [Penicillium camemberti]|uniref:Acyl carrier protein-like n=1 Tax=Penicillium camemberti (strain FM 013) TaxID=1429867 RepID=A0A0G4PR96_PENC3|nr:Acyl carrier protein-like [Penicillium camemberti]